MNDKKPLMDYRRVQKLQTPLLLTGALLSGVGTSVSVPLVILGIAIMLFAIVIGVLYYRCPHCGRPLGRIGEGGAYCPHCGKALNAPVEEPVRSITVPAYAKLNLTLDILGKRDDGYHEMQMVMQTVSLHDDVTVTLTDGKGITCRVDGAALPCDERNLAVKAARAFCEAMDYGGSIDIALIKRIPSEAGMAGGSADAAAVLRALRELVSPTLTAERLEQISASVGSDVPFCIRGGTQLAEGRGEKLTVLKPAPRFFVAACKPEFPVATPALVARVDGVARGARGGTRGWRAARERGAVALVPRTGVLRIDHAADHGAARSADKSRLDKAAGHRHKHKQDAGKQSRHAHGKYNVRKGFRLARAENQRRLYDVVVDALERGIETQ